MGWREDRAGERLGDLIEPGVRYRAEYTLEFESVGTLHPVPPGYSYSEGLCFYPVSLGIDPCYAADGTEISCAISQCILESEVAGEADVNVALYRGDSHGRGIEEEQLIGNYGFLVYFLEFEEVVLADTAKGSTIDVTTEASITGLDPGDAAEIAVQVKGFFQHEHSHLMPTTREQKGIDLNGDGVADKYMPAGRYVLPDDWWLLAETQDVSLRPNWDLMDMAHLDGIVSDAELGPYDSGVATASGSGEAANPCIGPFNTVQQWSVEDLWITDAMVAADMVVAAPINVWQPLTVDVRNTVVPDGEDINWSDCPMPQALVLFDIVAYNTVNEIPTLSGLDKGDLEGYGINLATLEYQSPFYAVEVPAHWVIPLGYNWDSWGIVTLNAPSDGPYDYWTDLQLDSINADTHEDPTEPDADKALQNIQDVEVFCDNHGIAGMQIDALLQTGSVTITATAEFPYSPKKGKYGPRVSDEITTTWGAEELNPHFIADVTVVDINDTITFDNLTAGGTHPYTKAEWDFDADGTPEITLVGTEAQVMADATWAYSLPGLYTVRLTMTDSTPTTRFEDRIDYILVAGVSAKNWNCPLGGEPLIAPNPGAGRPYLTIDADPAGITVSPATEQLLMILYLDESTGTWLSYNPSFATNTLTLLETDKFYYVIVSDACTVIVPQ